MNYLNRLVIPVLITCFASLSLFAQDKKVDERVWSQQYWKKMAEQGLVDVAKQQPVKPAQYTGSKLPSSVMLDTDDSPDVAIIDATNTTQSEVSVFVNPLDDNKVLNTNNSTDFPVSQVYGASGFMSADGGLTWTGSVLGTGGPNGGDPAAAINLQGRYHNGYIADNGGNGAAWSDDEGVTWTDVQVAPNPGSLADKNHLWVDNSPTSPYEGHVYAAYTDFGGSNDANIVIHTSTDRGASWGSGVNISATLPGFHQGVHIQTDANGVVYAFYTVYTSGGVTDEPAIGMTRSFDGGATWDTEQIIISGIRGIRSTGTLKNHRVAAFPVSAIDITGGARNNNIYVVWNNIGVPPSNTGPGINVLMISSSDGGNSWSSPTVVNQDDPADGNENYFPWISCDPVTGALSIVFYSDRNVASTDCEAFAANSLDGGATWEDFKISDVSFTPAPIPGLAGGYMGDYLGIASRGAKVYPIWADNRSGQVLAYTSPYILADPEDPNSPASVEAYSDFNTPTSIDLTWDDPTSLVDGTPILPGNFTIEIERDGSFLASVNGGAEAYTDNGLTDGTNYEYTLTTKLNANDSLSIPVVVSWTAGGAVDPASPTNLACSSDTAQAFLTWDDPTTQSDGTPLDDLADIVILRDGFPVGAVPAGTQSYTDTPPNPGFVYTYTVQARDNETPPNTSAPSNAVDCYVGNIPSFLVWVGPTVAGPSVDSGDSLLAALIANGESSFLTNDLFEFGTDLSVYEAIFVVLGIFSDNHVLGAADPEGDALNTYIANGGHIYLEGGDCFNYDPESAGGYQIRPWFGLDDGNDGSADVAGVVGLNDLSQFTFAYSGPNNFMDELVPVGSSTPVWQNDANADIHGVFNTDFGGRAIGVVPTFAGMDNNSNALYPMLREAEVVQKQQNIVDDVKYVIADKPVQPFTKKAGYMPELKRERDEIKGLFEVTAAGVKIRANNKVDLMAAYLGLFRNSGDASIGVDTTALNETLLVGGTSVQNFNITNIGGSLAGDLNYSIAQNPISSWLTANPTSGTLGGNQTDSILVTFDATGLAAGTYNTTLEVTSNDLNNPQIDIAVELIVNDAPSIRVEPDTIVTDTLFSGGTSVKSFTIFNDGSGPLEILSIEDEEASNKRYIGELPPQKPSRIYAKGEQEPTYGTQDAGLGGPDAFGYSWIDSNEPGGPVYDFTDISGTGTAVTLAPTGTFSELDEGMGTISLPSPVNFYGVSYNSVQVNTNGMLTFDPNYFDNAFTNQDMPSSDEPNLVVAPFWDDLDGSAGGTIYFQAIGNKYIVQWHNWGHYPAGTQNMTFQAVFFANSSTIWFVYENIDVDDGSQTVGIENTDGTIALQMAYNQAYAENQLLTKITLGADWLSANPTSGTIPAGGSLNVDLTAESGSLLGGTYTANVIINTNDPLNAQIKKPTVQMTVIGTADLTVTPDPVVTDTVFVGGTSVAEMLVQNTGTDVLNVFNIASSNGEFTVDPTGFMVDPGNTQVVNVSFMPTTEGAQTATLTITSNDPGTPSLDVTATGVGLIAPAIAVNPGSITESVDFGDSTDVTIQIDNNGGSNLTWAASLASGKTSVVNTKPTAATAEADLVPRTEGNGDDNNVIYGFGDLLVEYDLETRTGSQSHLGVEFAQNHFWITASQAGSPPNWIYKIDEGGAVVDSFSQPTTSWGWRDMAWDGTFLYGSVSPAVEQIDPATGQPTGVTIPGPENPNRALAYDPATDHFWTVNFGGSLYEFDRSGTVINTFPNPVSSYGAAWDVFTPGGPWIWLHAGTATGDTHFMVQVDPTTGVSTGLQFSGTTGNIAGGLTATGEMSSYPGQAVMVALGQTFSLSVWDLDAVSTPPFASLVGNTSGTIAPGDVDGVTVRFFGSEPDTTVMGNVNISSNDPVNGSIDVPYSLTVVGGLGIGDENEIPSTFALSQNYPNPFNPSTSIRYQLPKSADVKLVVYNTLGQKVRTLVNQRQDVGVYEARWDGRNESGVAVSSGIYIYRFEAADFKQIRKMIFLK